MKRAIKSLRPLTASEAEQLMVYGALDNPTRLIAYEIIHDAPDTAFNALARRVGERAGACPEGAGARGAARSDGPRGAPRHCATKRGGRGLLGVFVPEKYGGSN